MVIAASCTTHSQADPAAWEGKRVLFVHTGGVFGLFERAVQLQPVLEGWGTVTRWGGGSARAAAGATVNN